MPCFAGGRFGWDRSRGKHPMLRVRAELEKGNTDRLLPIAPEFFEFLMATPEVERTGPVFLQSLANRQRPSTLWSSKRISAFGQEAGIKVSTDDRTGKVKFTSAHDLRRAFGDRWAARVMPQVLQELMRQADISTTLRYYVGREAQRTADICWEAFSGQKGTILGTTSLDADSASRQNATQTSVD